MLDERMVVDVEYGCFVSGLACATTNQTLRRLFLSSAILSMTVKQVDLEDLDLLPSRMSKPCGMLLKE
ncbi:hypothetical protein HAX54_022450 [Datura stramonium]|uniref:Uncharacterized protein n=1 Tax=Datura stramonium TaxID=4076 RepID=A0ABS8UWD1_DATST|nr:hypothetical protein [Datura stramonium]